MTQHLFTATGLLALATAPLAAQTYSACQPASADAFAAAPGNAMFALPGVATDFVLAAGGQLIERGDGTARLSALLRRSSEIDRQFQLEIELAGAVLPGNPAPLGALPFELAPAAYVPVGPVDPTSFRYFTTGSGLLRGHGAYAGAIVDLQLNAPLQIGVGASNRNVLAGLACSFTVQVQSQPSFLVLNPTDEARLWATTSPGHGQCATHVDRDESVSQGPFRASLSLPGVSTDYVFIPTGMFTEHADGTATVAGTMRREDDFTDRWQLNLVLSGRTDPGDADHPPVEGPVLDLLPTAYVAGGGTLDPDTFRYYGTASGTLRGEDQNAGGEISLSLGRPAQVGLGANQGNRHLGLYAEVMTNVITQPNSRFVAPLAGASLRLSIATLCVLPYPNQTLGLHLVLDNVTAQVGQITGTNLAWIEQLSIGTRTITSQNPRNWHNGWLDVKSSSLVEVHPPQGMAPGSYSTRVYSRSIAGGVRQLTFHVPSQVTLRTADHRFAGESQDIVVSQGSMPAPTMAGLFYSFSNLPSPIPGIADFQIGAFFSDLQMIGVFFPDPVTKAVRYHVPAVPASIAGLRIYFQGALVDAATVALPASMSDVWSTLYQ